jgi:DNA-binding MurR/RpiR family transcriptional regulator
MAAEREINGILRRVQADLERLPKSQRPFARYLLTHLDAAVFLPLAKLARRTQSSESSIIRFAKGLGYKGFPEFRKDLQALLRDQLAPPERLHRAGPLPENPEAILELMLQRGVANLTETRKQINPVSLLATAEAIISAGSKYIVGLRGSAGVAKTLGFFLNQILPGVHVVTEGPPGLFDALFSLRKGDALLAVAYPQFTKATGDALRIARSKEALTITITNHPLSPYAQMAHIALVARSGPVTLGNSYVAAMYLVDALIHVVLNLCGEASLRRLETLEDVLVEYGVHYQDSVSIDDSGRPEGE